MQQSKHTATPRESAGPLMAKDVIDDYISFDYAGVKLILRKEEKKIFDQMPRKERRKMAQRFKAAIRKGRIKLVTVEGKTIAIKNKNYGSDDQRNQKNTSPGKSSFNKIRPHFRRN